MHAAVTDQAGSHDAERPAAYRFASRHATDPGGTLKRPALPWVAAVQGQRFACSERGRALAARHAGWLSFVDAGLGSLVELVELSRLVQVYRAPLRVGRQIPAAAYELHACSRLVNVVRKLELDVPTRGARRADLRAFFLSRAFHVEVKAHEDRRGQRRRGGPRAVRTLWQAAQSQASLQTPNLLVLGHVDAAAVRGAALQAPPDGAFGAVAWLDLRRRPHAWRGALHAVAGARHPFSSALLDVMRRRFESPRANR